MQGHLSVKADVYSFGVLLLELMSGRKNMDFNLSLELQILLKWVKYCFHYFSYRLTHSNMLSPMLFSSFIVRLTKLYEVTDLNADLKL